VFSRWMSVIAVTFSQRENLGMEEFRKHIDASKEGKDEEKSSFVCGRKESFVEPLTIGALRELRRINGNDLYLDITA